MNVAAKPAPKGKGKPPPFVKGGKPAAKGKGATKKPAPKK